MEDQNATRVEWPFDAQTNLLLDVLPGKPDLFRWVPPNSISVVNQVNQQRMGYHFDRDKALQQHQAMVEFAIGGGSVHCSRHELQRA